MFKHVDKIQAESVYSRRFGHIPCTRVHIFYWETVVDTVLTEE